MKPAKLREYGEHMFGPAWQKGFAEALGVNRGTVRAWYSKRKYYKMPETMNMMVKALLWRHLDKTKKLIKELEND